MLTNKVDLVLTADILSSDLSFVIKDNQQQSLSDVLKFDNRTCHNVSFSIAFPNTVSIHVTNNHPIPATIRLESLILSGLEVADHILDQICIFRGLSSETFVIRNWHCSGVISIDFFARDWIQYHLLYGNKIKK